MSFRSCLAVVTAVLFVLSAVAQHVTAAAMAIGTGMEMQVSLPGTASPDHTTHCPAPSDCGKEMNLPMTACFAHCVTVLGFLPEPALLPVAIVCHRLDWLAMHPLASLHGPPEPHPPRPVALI